MKHEKIKALNATVNSVFENLEDQQARCDCKSCSE